jgi:hypothetical protein
LTAVREGLDVRHVAPWAALALLLLVGGGLRLYFMTQWRPALLGFSDTAIYFNDAFVAPFWDPLRVVGYGRFLAWTHDLGLNLSATILLQHVLGMASAVLLFLTALRLGAPAWVGVVPAAVVLLGGQQLLLEHAVLSEALFGFLVCVAVFAAASARRAHGPAWSLLAGLSLGAAMCVRVAGVFAILAVIAWLAWAAKGALKLRAICAALALVGALIPVGVYVVERHDATGTWGMTTTGGWNLYARAATFADCDKFDPPAGTEALCEDTPPDQRPGPSFYAFDNSPAFRAFQASAQFPAGEEANEAVSRFARAAILGQPGDYLASVGRNLWRYVRPNAYAAQSGNSPAALAEQLFAPEPHVRLGLTILTYYGTRGWWHQPGAERIRDYERATRFYGPLVVICLLVMVAGLVLGRRRPEVALPAALALSLAISPVLTVFYDARYAVPVYGPLALAAALGGWALWERRRRRGDAGEEPAVPAASEPGPAPAVS